jgi:hypothetical protein
MANVARPNGLSPVAYLNGAAYNGQSRLYAIPTADTTASYAIGDVVYSRGSSDANGIPYVIKVPAASAASFVGLGVIVGICPVAPNISLVAPSLSLETTYIPAGTRSTVTYVFVADDPNTVFEASTGVAGATIASARKNYGLASFYSGADQTYAIDQTTYLSQSAPYSNIILANVNTTNTLPLNSVGFVNRIDNVVDTTGTATLAPYTRVLVRFNRHEFGNSGATGFTGI